MPLRQWCRRSGGLAAWSLVVATGLMASSTFAAEPASTPKPKVDTTTQPFSVKLAATRVIYDAASPGTSLSVINPQDYPMLVQSKVTMEDRKTAAPFVVTPPLFRLDGQQQSRLRIVRTSGTFPSDRETLNWLCVTGIPPKADDNWSKDENGVSQAPKNVALNVQVSISNCIKLFVRPATLMGKSQGQAESLTWTMRDGKLEGHNPTPFYANLNNLKVGGSKVDDIEYIAPFATRSFALPKGASGKVEWTVVNDYGGTSQPYLRNLQ